MRIRGSLSDSARNFLSLIAFVVVIGFAMGATYPMVALTMHGRGFSAALIGSIASCYAAASILSPLCVRFMLQNLGVRYGIILHMAMIIACILSYPFLQTQLFWFIARFIHGYAVNSLFTISEYYINALAHFHNRGKILGLYVAVLSAGFSAGPLLLLFVGSSGALPFLAIVGILIFSALPVLFLLHEQPFGGKHRGKSSLQLFISFAHVPHAILGGAMYGAVEALVFSLAAIYMLQLGYSKDMAAITLTFFSMGNIFFQIPIGFLCHKISPFLILFFLALASTVCSFALWFVTSQVYAIYFVMFCLGGVICGLYTTALVILGNTFHADLVSANTVFALFYSFGAFLGPFGGGLILDRYPKVGFVSTISIVCLSYFLFLCFFLIVKKEKKVDNSVC